MIIYCFQLKDYINWHGNSIVVNVLEEIFKQVEFINNNILISEKAIKKLIGLIQNMVIYLHVMIFKRSFNKSIRIISNAFYIFN